MTMEYEIRYDLLQPWSTFVMKTELPPDILEKMLRISDEIIENNEDNQTDSEQGAHLRLDPTTGSNKWGVGAGQLKDQFFIDLAILEREEIQKYFSGVCTHFVELAFGQSNPGEIQEELHAWPTTMWINSQKDNEYFPAHDHAHEDAIAAAMYLKIPEYLPDRKVYSGFAPEDGAIVFINNSSTDKIWAHNEFYVLPEVGDLLIFPASQQHMVYPFRTADGKGERRSVSFNATFTSKSNK